MEDSGLLTAERVDDLFDGADVIRRDVSGAISDFEDVAFVDGVEMVGAPGAEVLAPGAAFDADQAVVFAFGFSDDFVGVEDPGGDLWPLAGGGDGGVVDAGDVRNRFVESGAAVCGEVVDAFDVEAEHVHELEAAEALAEVADAPVGVGAAAVGAGDAQEAGDALVHPEGVDHVAGVEAAHGMGDEQDLCVAVEVEGGEAFVDDAFELGGSAGDGAAGVDFADDDLVAGFAEGFVDALEVGPAEIPYSRRRVAEKAVVEDDDGFVG